MTIEEFKNKYEEMEDSDIYKNYCSILENKDSHLRNILKEKQELIYYLKEQINECPITKNDEADMFYIGKMRAYQEILSKIEKE